MAKIAISLIEWREAWNVKGSALLDLPDSLFRRAVQGLAISAHQIWLRPKDARRLCALDRAARGGSQVPKTEFKRCDMCARPLLGIEAKQRRKLIETGPTARTLSCGPNCERDRKPRGWKKLAKASSSTARFADGALRAAPGIDRAPFPS
jgi:hypothetical protein